MADVLNTITLVAPEAGQNLEIRVEAARIQLDFPVDNVVVTTSGRSLVFAFENGARMTLVDFLDILEGEEDVAFVLADGAVVPAGLLLASLGGEAMETAAGGSPQGGGGSVYEANLGDLLNSGGLRALVAQVLEEQGGGAGGFGGNFAADFLNGGIAGNSSDTTPPAAPSVPDLAPLADTGISDADDLTADNTPTFTGTGEPGAVVALYVVGLGYVGGGIVAGNGTWSVTTSVLPDGVHGVFAVQVDAAGNISNPSGTIVVTIDTAGPLVDDQTLGVDENSAAGTVVGSVDADDLNGVAAYGFKHGDNSVSTVSEDGYFVIDPVTGVISLTEAGAAAALLDYETAPGAGVYTVVVTDMAGNVTEAAITVAVQDVNEAPVAAAELVSAVEGAGTVSGTVSATDPDAGDVLTYALVGTAPAGLVFKSDGTYSFNPNIADYNSLKQGETITFDLSYTVTDAAGLSDTAAFTITVTGTNDAPVAKAATLLVEEGFVPEETEFVTGKLEATDVDGDALTYSLVSAAPAGFTLNGDGTYTFDATNPAYDSLKAGQVKTMVVTYKVEDGNGGEATAKLTIKVTGTNDAPVASAHADVTVAEGDALLRGKLAATDVDGDRLTFTLDADSDVPAGFVLKPNGSYSFNPKHGEYNSLAVGQEATFTIKYTVTDVHGATDTGSFTITVTGTNDKPVAKAATLLVEEGFVPEETEFVTGKLEATDVDGDALTYSLVSAAPAGFTLNGDGTYTFDATNPAYDSLKAGQVKTMVVTYKVEDGNGGEATAKLTIKVTGTNDAPVASAHADVTVAEGDALLRGKLAATDVDGDRLTFTLDADSDVPAGFVLKPNGSYSFNPKHGEYNSLAVGQEATFTIKYTVTDVHGATDTGSFTITVTGTNDKPVAKAATLLVEEGFVPEETEFVTGKLEATDVDGDVLTYSLVSAAPAGFTLNGDGTYTFDATNPAYDSLKAGQVKTMVVTYKVEDGNGGEATAKLTIKVTGTNDAPVASAHADVAATEGGALVKGRVTATDVDGDSLSFSVVDDVPGFTMQPNGSYTFDPKDPAYDSIAQGEVRDVVVTYKVEDGNGGTDTQTLTFKVTGVNDAPVANDITYADGAQAQFGLTGKFYAYDNQTHGADTTWQSSQALNIVLAHLAEHGSSPDATFVADTLAFGPKSNTLNSLEELRDFIGSNGHSVAATEGANFAGADRGIMQLSGQVNLDAGTYRLKVYSDDGFQIKVDGVVVAQFASDRGAGTTVSPEFTITDSGYHSIEIVYWDQGGAYVLNVAIAEKTGATWSDYTVLGSTMLVQDGVAPDPFVGLEDNALTFNAADILAHVTDPDSGDTASLHSVQLAPGFEEAGSLVWDAATGSITFTPADNWHGDVLLTYTAKDNNGAVSNTGKLTLHVASVNDAPVLSDGTLTVDGVTPTEDTALLFTTADIIASLNGFDVEDGTNLSVTSLTLAEGQGTITDLGNGNYRFDPAQDFNGKVTFNVTVADSDGATASAKATFTVEAVNDAPVAVSEIVGVSGLTGSFYAFDNQKHGTWTSANALNMVLAHIAGSETPDATFTVSALDFAPQSGTLNSLGELQTFLGGNGGNVVQTGSFDGADRGIMHMSGTVYLAAGTYKMRVYSDDGFQMSIDGKVVGQFATDRGAGTTTFEFTVAEDGYYPLDMVYWDQGGAYVLKVEIQESGAADWTVLGSAAEGENFSLHTTGTTAPFSGLEDTPLTVSAADLLANDRDADGDALSLTDVSVDPAHGTVTLDENGNILFTPAKDFYGEAVITYHVTDGQAVSNAATFTVVVDRVANGVTYTVNDDEKPNPVYSGDGIAYDGTYTLPDGTVTVGGDGSSVAAGGAWNTIKSVKAQSDADSIVTISNFVRADVDLSAGGADGDGVGSTVLVENVKRAEVQTGSEADDVTITAWSNKNSGGWHSNINVETGAGDDKVTLSVNPAAKLGGQTAAAETVFTVDAGDGNDTITLTGGGYKSALLEGGAGNDTITGGDLADILDGGSGDDLLFGGAGNDTIYGGTGNDTITGGAGNDLIDGGEGTDTAVYAGNRSAYKVLRTEDGRYTVQHLDGAEGTDTLVSVEYVQFANGVFAIAGLVEPEGKTFSYADFTNNSLTGSEGADIINISGKMEGAAIYGGGGSDRITVGGKLENGQIHGGAGDDSISVGDKMEGAEIRAGAGDDVISVAGKLENGQIHGEDGNDLITVGGRVQGAAIYAGSGNDTVVAGDNLDTSTINTGNGDDAVILHGILGGGSRIEAGAGDDTVVVGGNVTGWSSVDAGAGDNAIVVGGNLNAGTITAGAGNDTVIIGGKTDGWSSVTTGDGDDVIFIGGTMKNTTINAGAGNDRVILADYDVTDVQATGGKVSFNGNTLNGVESLQFKDGSVYDVTATGLKKSSSAALALGDLLSDVADDDLSGYLSVSEGADGTVTLGIAAESGGAAMHSVTFTAPASGSDLESVLSDMINNNKVITDL